MREQLWGITGVSQILSIYILKVNLFQKQFFQQGSLVRAAFSVFLISPAADMAHLFATGERVCCFRVKNPCETRTI